MKCSEVFSVFNVDGIRWKAHRGNVCILHCGPFSFGRCRPWLMPLGAARKTDACNTHRLCAPQTVCLANCCFCILFLCLFACSPVCFPVCSLVRRFGCLFFCLFACLFACSLVWLSVFLHVRRFVRLPVRLFACSSFCFPVCSSAFSIARQQKVFSLKKSFHENFHIYTNFFRLYITFNRQIRLCFA